MSRDKQIEEMAKLLDCPSIVWGMGEITERGIAEALYNAGYRKASDVASDIIGEITRYVNSHQAFLTPIPMSEVIGFGEFLGELEKKYTEGDE